MTPDELKWRRRGALEHRAGSENGKNDGDERSDGARRSVAGPISISPRAHVRRHGNVARGSAHAVFLRVPTALFTPAAQVLRRRRAWLAARHGATPVKYDCPTGWRSGSY